MTVHLSWLLTPLTILIQLLALFKPKKKRVPVDTSSNYCSTATLITKSACGKFIAMGNMRGGFTILDESNGYKSPMRLPDTKVYGLQWLQPTKTGKPRLLLVSHKGLTVYVVKSGCIEVMARKPYEVKSIPERIEVKDNIVVHVTIDGKIVACSCT